MSREDSKIITGMIIGLAVGIGASCMVHAARRGHWMEKMEDFASRMKHQMKEKCKEMNAECKSNTEPEKTM
ncbi:MAG: hypothetical protein IJ483_05440 [Flavobacteriales bacterium]|nr:hypothetical protein [Flavobacteriales bacterium]